ncbi:MAG: hypothetical protein WBZ36_13280 [Candidatus Nitrosopolaris sp.]|jgi:hypothetical protein
MLVLYVEQTLIASALLAATQLIRAYSDIFSIGQWEFKGLLLSIYRLYEALQSYDVTMRYPNLSWTGFLKLLNNERLYFLYIMKAGILLPQAGDSATRENILYVAKGAEREGLDSVWVFERLLWPLCYDRLCFSISGSDFASSA